MTRTPAKRRPMLNEPAPADMRQPENWGPADEPTVRKRNKSVLEEWRDLGDLDPAIEASAYEIENVHRALVAGLWTKTSSYGERIAGNPNPDWPHSLCMAYKRYGPWRDKLNVHYLKTRQPVQEIVVAALIDGVSLRTLDRVYQWRKGTASRVLKFSLRLYAVMAGWERRN